MKNLLAALFCLLLATACTHFEEPKVVSIEQSETETEPQPLTRATAVVSDQNPYSLANVQEAYNDMRPSLGLPSKTITATHHYVRFNIQDSLMYKTIHDDLGLELIEYPLDKELSVAEMNAYMNDISNTWYYTVVPTGFKYPQGVDHEFLDYVYMQAEPATRAPGDVPQIDDEDYDLVIEKAMQNNGINVVPLTRGSAWYPSATINFQDDYDRNGDGRADNIVIPLKGVKVRCTHFINVGSGTTDANGNVSGIKGWGGKFRNPVGYHIIWDNPKWNIRDGRTGQAKTHGPKQKTHWNLTIASANTKDAYFAAVHRGLWAYFYETYPLANGITKARVDKMDTGVLWDKDHPDRVARFDPTKRTFGGNIILVYGKEDGAYRGRWEVTGSMFHELGHATHWQAVIDKRGANRIREYHNADDRLVESWARGVQSSYMRAFYSDYLQRNYFGNYTAVVESMMNQGMTLKQIEDALVGESNWSNWRSNILATGSIPAALVNMIFDNPLTPVRVNMTNPITGNIPSGLNVNTTYNIPANLPLDIRFTDWTITPSSGHTITGGTTSRDLDIKFTAYGTYTLTANFRLPNGTNYPATKTITLSPPTPITPVIVASGPVLSAGEQQWAGIPAGVKGYWVQPGTCVVSINQNYDQAATYEWDTGGLPSAQLTGPYTRSITTLGNNSIYEIKCRAYKNGQYSAWGTLYLYVSTSAPKSIYLLKDKPKEDEFEESDDENPDSTEIDETITLE